MANAGMPQVGELVAGKYRVEGVIGEGGMGAVLAATHELTGKRVALKWLRPELAANEGAVQRFMREAQAAGRIDHPNVVDIYDVGQHEGSTFLVMELLQGEPLSALIARGAMSVRDTMDVLLPAMRGVAAAHATGVVHRDLKPDNIFVCRGTDGSYREPKVLDFGISKVSSRDGQLNPRLTRTGAVMGTPYYMSPEQIRDSAEIDQRTDVYAFGVILYEALSGRVPFDGESYSSLILQIATGTPPSLRQLTPALPEGLERVVTKAMTRDPEERYADVVALARSLEPYALGTTFSQERRGTGSAPMTRTLSATTPFTSEAPAAPPLRRSPLLWVLGAAALVAASVIAGLYLTRSAQPPQVVGSAAPPPAESPSTAVPPSAPATAAAARPELAPTPPVAPSQPSAVQAAAPAAQPAARPEPTAPSAPAASAGRPRSRRAAPTAAPAPTTARSGSRSGGLRSDEF